MALGRLTFDTTDANTIADSHHVGAHTLAGDGSLITSGDGSADNVANTFEGLDIRSFMFGYDATGDNWDRVQQVAGALKVYIDDGDFGIDVKLDGVYDGVNNTDPDNVGLIVHARSAAPGDVNQTFRSTGGSIGDVLAADIANVHALDVNSFMLGFDGTDWQAIATDASGNVSVTLADASIAVTQGTSPWVIGDGGGSITVDAVDLDIRDLTHVSDSVALGDGTNLYTSTTIGSDIGLDVNVINDPATANSAIANASNTLDAANTAEDVVAAPLANRKYLYIYNNDNRTAYIGATGVTAANGFPLDVTTYIELRAGAAVDIEWVSAKVGHDLRTLELA